MNSNKGLPILINKPDGTYYRGDCTFRNSNIYKLNFNNQYQILMKLIESLVLNKLKFQIE